MKFKIYCLLVAVFSLQFSISLCDLRLGYCPDLTATFVTVINQTFDDPLYTIADPEMTFFKDIMGFRDDEIQHAFEDAVKFFNETYALDFTLSPPNEQNEYFFENAKMTLFRFREDVRYRVVFNNWIHTGSTHTSCDEVQIGGYIVTFTGDQLLHGSYGGVEGIPATVGEFTEYGYNKFYVCDQSPVIIQIQNATPFRREPIDGTLFLHFDTYNNILGYGKAMGVIISKPDRENPEKYRAVVRVVFTFSGN